MTAITATLQSFFTDRLTSQRQASAHTIASYRDTLRLFLQFMHRRTGKSPSRLDWADLNAAAVSAFLDHLEVERHNGPRTRNARLAAIQSLFRYAALRHPEHAGSIGRVLAIPPKRCDRAIVAYLDRHRGRRPAGRARPQPPGSAAATTPCCCAMPNRAAGLRTDRDSTRGDIHLGHRRARPMPRLISSSR